MVLLLLFVPCAAFCQTWFVSDSIAVIPHVTLGLLAWLSPAFAVMPSLSRNTQSPRMSMVCRWASPGRSPISQIHVDPIELKPRAGRLVCFERKPHSIMLPDASPRFEVPTSLF